MANYPKAKMRCQGAANFDTAFNPAQFYSNNNNYLKVVVCADWLNSSVSANYLYHCQNNWFSFEKGYYGGSNRLFFDVGSYTLVGYRIVTNTDGFEKPVTLTIDNGQVTVSQNGNTETNNLGNFNTGLLSFFKSGASANADIEFYSFEVYDRSDNLIYKFIPWQDGNGNPCIVNTVTDDVLYPTGSGYTLTYTNLQPFTPSQDTFTFNANGGTQTFTVEADNAWTCAAPTDFTISPMSGTAGITTVTITAPSRISTVSDTVTFTDSQSNTFDISISQSVGTTTPNLTLYQGATTIKKMYYGDSLVYRKMAHSPSLVISGDSFTFPPTSYTASTVVVTTDANWSYSTEVSWLSLSKTGNNLEIVPTSDWDQGSEPRTATVTVTADNGFITKSAEISVKQKNTNVENVDWVWVENQGMSTGTYIDTGIIPTTDTSFRVVFQPLQRIGSALVGYTFAGDAQARTPMYAADDDSDYRVFFYNSTSTMYFDFNSSRISKSVTNSGGFVDLTCTNNSITDNLSGQTTTGAVQASMVTTTVPLYIGLSNYAKVRSVEIWQGQTKVYDGHAAWDGENYGWYDSVSGTFSTQTYGGYALTGPSI